MSNINASNISSKSVTCRESIIIPQNIPSEASVGSMYFDTEVNQLLVYNGEEWSSGAGAAGAQGPTGAKGEQGLKGTKGDQGPTGITGSVGTKGDQGPTGITGSVGTKGDQGPTGITGPTGTKGDLGSTGVTGPKGESGSGTLGPAFSAYASGGSQSISNAVIAFNLEEFDTNTSYNTTNNRWTPGVAGYYHINTLVSCKVDSGSGDAYVVLRKNGSTWLKASTRYATSLQFLPLAINTVIYLNATDYIDVFGVASATVSTNATFGAGTNQAWVYFNGCFLRDA